MMACTPKDRPFSGVKYYLQHDGSLPMDATYLERARDLVAAAVIRAQERVSDREKRHENGAPKLPRGLNESRADMEQVLADVDRLVMLEGMS